MTTSESGGREESLTIPSRDGFPLGATYFRNHASDRPVVIIAPATAVKQAYYRKFATYLSENGFHALTFDYRGVGGSRPKQLKNFHAALHEWSELDLAAVIAWANEHAGSNGVLLVGHSVAGQIFPLADNNHLVRAACFVASQSGYWGLWPGLQSTKIFIFWNIVIPVSTALLGYFPGRLMGNAENLPYGVAREWAKWGRQPNYILSHSQKVSEAFASIEIPLRFLSFPHDHFAPLRAVQELVGWYGSKQKEHLHLDPNQIGANVIDHFGFFREQFADTLWRETVQWLRSNSPLTPPLDATGASKRSRNFS